MSPSTIQARGSEPRWRAAAPLLALLACTEAAPSAERAPRPHIVLVLADDLGRGDVGWLGSEIRTPHLDRLAAESVDLERCYVQPSCTPTRAALLTGRYPIRYGLQSGILRPWEERGLDLGETLLPELLARAGYATHMVGKWHLGAARREQLPTARGFAHHYGLYHGLADYFERTRDGGLDWFRDGEPVREDGYTTHLLRDEAVRVIEAHDAQGPPLFLYLAFSAPHFPLQAPEDELAAYASAIDDPDRRTYAAMVSCMDEALGAVVGALEARGMARDTLLVFLSDNGASVEHGGSNGGLAGGKNGLGEGGVRVPAFVRWPAELAPRRVAQPVHVVDLVPTLAGAAGVALDGELALDGADLGGLLRGGHAPERGPLLLNVAPNVGAVVDGPWKLVVDYVERQRGSIEADPLLGAHLYDVEADPREQHDRIAERPPVLPELLAALARFRAQMRPSPPERASTMPEGYVVPADWGPRGG